MRSIIKLFFLTLVVQASYLQAYRDKFEDSLGIKEKNTNAIKVADDKSPEELTFDRVWEAYNGLRHRLDSVLARGHYASEGSKWQIYRYIFVIFLLSGEP